MPNLTRKELISIKDLVSAHQILVSKLNSYSNSCQSPEIKQMFQSAAGEAKQSAQSLIQML
ncbi:MAG: hypothetical protein LBV08_06055 [Clostridiales bacterium]|jgi:hypothetical protein|nr:hypothetical protein [Clostridiales bacterium]